MGFLEIACYTTELRRLRRGAHSIQDDQHNRGRVVECVRQWPMSCAFGVLRMVFIRQHNPPHEAQLARHYPPPHNFFYDTAELSSSFHHRELLF
jgi:hypothetical protein